jgi:ribosomal protein L37AE/L43A
MPRCGVCGGGIALTVVPHAELCDDDVKAKPIQHLRQENEMSKCIKCGRKITYESATEEGFWACSDCGQPTTERADD